MNTSNVLQRYASISIEEVYVDIEKLKQKISDFEIKDGVVYIPLHEYSGSEESYLNEFSETIENLEQSLKCDPLWLPCFRRMYNGLDSLSIYMKG